MHIKISVLLNLKCPFLFAVNIAKCNNVGRDEGHDYSAGFVHDKDVGVLESNKARCA